MACDLKNKTSQKIEVFVRIRPLNQQEPDGRSTSCVHVVNSRELSIKNPHEKKYYFDCVFGPTATQVDVHMTVINPMISEVLTGYNCTIFAYEQTGTGKTHTMASGSDSNTPIAWQTHLSVTLYAAIICLRFGSRILFNTLTASASNNKKFYLLSHLFEHLQVIQQEYTVRVSYLELYNEELYDFLAEGNEFARIRLFEGQHQKGSVIIEGIEQMTVLNDLAGSENIGRSGTVENRAQEAGNMHKHKSLLTLGI